MSSPSILNKTPIKIFFNSLLPEERLLFKQYAGLIPIDATVAQALMIVGANLTPQGHYDLAEKSLLQGIAAADTNEEKARLHLNLAQLYFDLHEQTNEKTYFDNSLMHCQKCIALGYFVDFIKENFPSFSLDMPIQ